MQAYRKIISTVFLGQSVLMSFCSFYLTVKCFLNISLVAEILRLLLGWTDMFEKECLCVHALQSPAVNKVLIKPLQANKACLLEWLTNLQRVFQVTNTDLMWAKLLEEVEQI